MRATTITTRGGAEGKMKQTLNMQFIGGGDEETARLRLLLRKARPRLEADWELSEDEQSPDLVIIDPATLAGDAARVQARDSGRPFVCVVEPDAADSGEWQLRRPLKLEALVRVVNALTPGTEPGARILSQGEDFFLVDLGESGEGGSGSLLDAEALSSIPSLSDGGGGRVRDAWGDDAEALFKRDPDALRPGQLVPHEIDEDTEVELVGGGGRRAEARHGAALARSGAMLTAPGDRTRERVRNRPQMAGALPLVELLEGQILGGPHRIEYGGLPALVLDPKNDVYHSAADLSDLELYCLQPLPMAAFEQLTGAEIESVRAMLPAQSGVRLRWLAALVNDSGKLAPHLDPGGRYQLMRYFQLATDYSHYHRIATAMATPRKISEIAAAAGRPVDEVIKAINAFDAVGYVQWTFRDRLLGVEPTEEE